MSTEFFQENMMQRKSPYRFQTDQEVHEATSRTIPMPGDIYRHYKGTRYLILANTVYLEADGKRAIAYAEWHPGEEALRSDLKLEQTFGVYHDVKIWIRSVDDFLQNILWSTGTANFRAQRFTLYAEHTRNVEPAESVVTPASAVPSEEVLQEILEQARSQDERARAEQQTKTKTIDVLGNDGVTVIGKAEVPATIREGETVTIKAVISAPDVIARLEAPYARTCSIRAEQAVASGMVDGKHPLSLQPDNRLLPIHVVSSTFNPLYNHKVYLCSHGDSTEEYTLDASETFEVAGCGLTSVYVIPHTYKAMQQRESMMITSGTGDEPRRVDPFKSVA